MKLDLGTTIDRYVVEAVIGAGGTAMVYRVRHTHLGTLHALKVLTISSDAIRKRMLNEGKVQATLRHLNLVAVTDVLSIGGAPGLLMEYIEGPSLERALGGFKIRMGDAETLFVGIVAGVRQAHQLGLVHRDLKPANVLLARARAGFIPKVTDFGLVKTLSDDPAIGATRSGIAMGTPSYMAPEQIRDARTVDRRADIWSLGCILYELVTRRRAFPGDDALGIYNAVTVGDFPEPRRWVPDLPDRLERAILGCLTVDRSQRIPDCDTLLAVMRGERSWALPDFPEPEHATDEMPRPLPENVPDMPVAERGPGGSTPGPAPARSGAPPVPSVFSGAVAESTVMLPGQQGVEGTLNDLVDPPEEAGGGWLAVGALVSLLVAGAAFVAVIGVFAVSAWLLQPEEQGRPPIVPGTPPTQPVQVTPPRPADTPAPAPAPVPSPAPAPAPAPVVVPVAPVPAPEPTPRTVVKPVEHTHQVVKILSSPPTALVRLNGESRGRTPLKLELKPGNYAVSLTSGGAIADYQVTVVAGGTNKWCYAFETATNVAGSCP